jgi:glucan 1,3-beta-glucosidase
MAVVFVLLATTSIGASGLLLMILSGAACGAALWQGAIDLPQWARNPLEAGIGGAYLVAAGLASFYLARALAAWCDGIAPAGAPASIAGLLRWFVSNESEFDARERALGVLRFVLLFGMAAVCLLLFADPRYRDFPVAVFAVPAGGFGLLALVGGRRPVLAPGPEECSIAVLIAISTAGIALQEGWQNAQAMEWCGVSLVFAASVIAPWLGARARAGARA